MTHPAPRCSFIGQCGPASARDWPASMRQQTASHILQRSAQRGTGEADLERGSLSKRVYVLHHFVIHHVWINFHKKSVGLTESTAPAESPLNIKKAYSLPTKVKTSF